MSRQYRPRNRKRNSISGANETPHKVSNNPFWQKHNLDLKRVDRSRKEEFVELFHTILKWGKPLCGEIKDIAYWQGFTPYDEKITNLYAVFDQKYMYPDLVAFAIIRAGLCCHKSDDGDEKEAVKCGYTCLDNAWYIELICAKKVKHITESIGIQLIEQVALDATNLGLDRITLSALPRVINYYRNKLNFKISVDCQESAVLKKLADSLREWRYDKRVAAHEDPTFQPLLQLAYQNGLAVISKNPNCEGYNCVEDGIYMTRCLKALEIVISHKKRRHK